MIARKPTLIKKVEEFKDKIEALKVELENFKDELDEDVSNIQPYGDKDELTPQQQEREDWENDLISSVESSIYDLESAAESLNWL